MRENVRRFLINLGLGNDFEQLLDDPRTADTIAHYLILNHIQVLESLLANSVALSLDEAFWQKRDAMGRTIGHIAIMGNNGFLEQDRQDNIASLDRLRSLVIYREHLGEGFWDLQDCNGETLSHLAARVNAIETIQLLLTFMNTDHWRIVNLQGLTIVHIAAMSNVIDLLNFFINNNDAFGFDRNFWALPTHKGSTVAHLAATSQTADSLRLLLERFEALELPIGSWQIRNNAGNTIAHELFTVRGKTGFPEDDQAQDECDSCLRHKVDMLQMLIENRDRLGLTDEFWRARNNDLETIAHLATNMHARWALNILAGMHDTLGLNNDFWLVPDIKGFSLIPMMTNALGEISLVKALYYRLVLLKLRERFPDDVQLNPVEQSYFPEIRSLAVHNILSSELEKAVSSKSFPGELVCEINGYLIGRSIAENASNTYDSIVLDLKGQQANTDPINRIEIGRAITSKLEFFLEKRKPAVLSEVNDDLQSKLAISIELLNQTQSIEHALKIASETRILLAHECYVDQLLHDLGSSGAKSLETMEEASEEKTSAITSSSASPNNASSSSSSSDRGNIDNYVDQRRRNNIKEAGSNLPMTSENKPLEVGLTKISKLDGYIEAIRWLSEHIIRSMPRFVIDSLPTPQGYADVPGDGLCFYHAIAAQLSDENLIGQQLQQMAIDEVLNHPDRYGAFAEGGLEVLLNYHLQRQESNKGGWADNIMIQALADALNRVIEVQRFDLQGNALGGDPVRIVPHNDAGAPVLRLGNIADLHFVARIREDNLDDGGNRLEQLYDAVEEANSSSSSSFSSNIMGGDNPGEDQGVELNKSGSTPLLRFASASSPTPNPTEHYETLEFGDASSFEFGDALILSDAIFEG